MVEKLGFSVDEFREAYGLGRNAAYEVVNRADFPAVRIGRRIIIPVDEVKVWMKKQISNESGEQ